MIPIKRAKEVRKYILNRGANNAKSKPTGEEDSLTEVKMEALREKKTS